MGGAEDASKTLVDPPRPESEWAPSVASFAETPASTAHEDPVRPSASMRPVFAGAAAEPRVSKTVPDSELEVTPTVPERPATADIEKPRARGARRPSRLGGRRDRAGSARETKASTARMWLVGVSAFALGIGLTAAFFSLRSNRSDPEAATSDPVVTSAAPRRIPPVVSPVTPPRPRLRPEARDPLSPGLAAPSAKPAVKTPNARVPPPNAPHPSEFEF